MKPDIKTWRERLPAPRRAYQCDMNCSGVKKTKAMEQSCGDCYPITVHGDPVKARDEEIAELRARLQLDEQELRDFIDNLNRTLCGATLMGEPVLPAPPSTNPTTAFHQDTNKRRPEELVEIVKRVVKRGDVLTHTGCMGCLFEHEFIRWDGEWIVGRPTRDTFRFEQMDGRRGEYCHQANDIAPANVTHINRVPVECIEHVVNHPLVGFKEIING